MLHTYAGRCILRHESAFAQEEVNGLMKYEKPTIRDHGSIAKHTFTRCPTGAPVAGAPPKDFQDFPLDKFGECSAGHAS